MSERRENSVLFSLKELRNIEDGRVRKEKEEAQARVDAERAAKAAAERAVREAEERRIREEEERVRRIEEEKENRVREEQMRLQEAERRARVEGEVRLQEERMRLEVAAKHEQKSPMKAILGVAGILVIIGGGLGYKMYSDHQAEIAAANKRLADAQEQARLAQAELTAKLAANQKDMDEKLAAAKTEAEKAQIRLEHERAKAEIQSGRTSHSSPKSTGGKDEKFDTQKYRKVEKKAVTDNPLEGL
jgi:hypothetical protein